MEQNPPQASFPAMHRVPVPASSIPEYWPNSLDTNPTQFPPTPQPLQQQPSQPPQTQPPQQSQPLGISWDHPVFQQQNRQQGHVAPRPDQNHGIYSPAPQSWRPNPLDSRIMSTPPQGFGVPPSYQQLRHYPQSHFPFDSPSIHSSENSPYSFPQTYYSPAQLQVQDTFSQSPPMQSVQSQAHQLPQFQTSSHQPPVGQYTMPVRFSEETLHTPVHLPNGYDGANSPDHRTINPQFLNSPQQATNLQHIGQQNKFLYVTPEAFERQKLMNLYRQNLQVPPVLQQPGNFQPKTATELPQKKLAPQNQLQPQKKKARVKTVGKPSDASSVSDSGSDDSGESDLEVEEADEPSPIPATRPSEPAAAAEYDTLQAVWSPRNKPPSVDKVKNALVSFKDVVKAVRDTWKESTQSMKMAENKDENDKAAKIKEEVVLQRRLINVVISTTLEKGHPKIVEKLGEHPMAVSALYSFLLDRHQACDNDGELTVNILKLLARFSTIDEDILQKTNVAKLLPRLVKKGGQTVRDLSQKILDNAAAATKWKKEKSPPKEEPPKKTTTTVASTDKARGELAGSKRPREGEPNGLPGYKRVLTTSQTKNNTQKPANAATGPAKRPQETGQDAKTTAMASRPKANIVAPKPTNLFGSLNSASKRPGTSNAERAAAAAAKVGNGSPEKKGTPPPKPAFSFGDLMADLNKQKESATTEPSEIKTPETEEEREKRLRKEKRRKLRVSWKPDDSLTEVRFFTHDPEEELGPGERAAGDVKGEGRVLKLHRDLDELDDEDDGGIREETLVDYHLPANVNFGAISLDDQSRNFIKRGGNHQPVSPQKQAQDHREATTLMVFYTSPADVPSTPKEPPAPEEDEMATDVLAFGELPDQVKARQDRYYAAMKPKPPPSSQPTAQTNQFDISNLLKIIQGAPQQQQPPPPPPPVSQAPMSDLERTINMFRQQQPPQVPQFQPQAAPTVDLQRILAVMNAQNQMQQPSVFPQPPPSQPAVAPNIAAIVSQFANQNQVGANQSGQFHEDPERKRMRERDGYEESFDDRFNPNKRVKQPGLMKHPKAGLIPCRYWKEGKCIKGDECTFRHDPR